MFKNKRWGWYLVLCNRRSFKVKLLFFKKGGAISLQRHKHRKELWCFIFGHGSMLASKDQNELKAMEFKKGDNIYIPIMTWHKYTAFKRTLVLEVQTGKCNEEDIQRCG